MIYISKKQVTILKNGICNKYYFKELKINLLNMIKSIKVRSQHENVCEGN